MGRTRSLLMTFCLIVLATVAGCSAKGTPTPISTPTPIPGWERFEGGGVAIWLPERYVLIDLSQSMDDNMERMGEVDPEFLQAVADLKNTATGRAALSAIDYQADQSGYYPNLLVAVNTERTLGDMTLEQLLKVYVQGVQSEYSNFKVVSQGVVELDRYQAGRLVLEYQGPSASWQTVNMLVKQGAMLWQIMYTAGYESFETLLPEFDLSARTFEIRPRY